MIPREDAEAEGLAPLIAWHSTVAGRLSPSSDGRTEPEALVVPN
jgi:hypothetical protein